MTMIESRKRTGTTKEHFWTPYRTWNPEDGPRIKCACGAPAVAVCDHVPVPEKAYEKYQNNVCQKPLCAKHAMEVGQGLHCCPPHHRAVKVKSASS